MKPTPTFPCFCRYCGTPVYQPVDLCADCNEALDLAAARRANADPSWPHGVPRPRSFEHALVSALGRQAGIA